jgi:4-amino-4-deoxy-L-arabinose transferase-like glycosyltransferase
MLYILAGTAITPFHGDEATQIFMSRDYAYQFMQRDFARLAYRDPPGGDQEQHLRLLNGTINKYLIGLAWHISGFAPEDINEQWDWGADWDYNRQNGHAPSDALLRAARWPSSILLAGGVVVMFALGDALGGRTTAYLASLYYALCPPLLLNGHRAMMEGSLTFFSLLTVLCGVWFAGRRSWVAALMLGVSAGLALASKHSAVFAIVAVYSACLILNHKGTKDTKRIFVSSWLKILISTVFALVLFYVLNPAWWGDPITRAGQVLGLRQELLSIQTSVFGGYASPLDALGGFTRQVLVVLPQYSVWRGVSVGGSLLGAALLVGMLVVGLWALVRRLGDPAKRVIGAWALAVVLSTLLLTPVEWQRYYVPAYPAVGLIGAFGVTSTLRFMKGINHKDTKNTKKNKHS